MKTFLLSAVMAFLLGTVAQAQNFFLETSMPKSAGMNIGARFTAHNNINDVFSLVVMGRIHRFSVLNNGVAPEQSGVVNAFEVAMAGGLKFNFVNQRSFQAYINPMGEIATYNGDAGLNAGAYLGITKEIAWPLVFNFEVGARQRLVLWQDAIATNNRMAIFIGGGFGLNLIESYQGPGPVLLNKTRPNKRKTKRYY